jgi:hypothetical protein
MISKINTGKKLRQACLLLFFTCLSLVFFISCTGKRHNIISEKKLIRVLVDIHLADGMALVLPYSSSALQFDSTSLYNAVFTKHHITKAMFDSTMAFYTHKPAKLEEVYTEVNNILSKMDSDLDTGGVLSDAEKKILVWQDSKTYILPQMGKINKVEINVPSSKPGIYTFSAKVRLFEDDQTVAPRITLFFWFDNGTPKGYRQYFRNIPLTRDGKTNTYTISNRLTNSNVTHIKGFLLDHSNPDTLFAKHAIISDIKVQYNN